MNELITGPHPGNFPPTRAISWTGSATPAATVPADVLRHAALTPHQPAVVDRSGTLAYGQLVDRAVALAAVLRPLLGTAEPAPAPATRSPSATPGPEPLVAVLAPRTADVVVAQLAGWLAGAAFLPLDGALPPARIAQIVERAGCRVAVAHDRLADRFPPSVTVVTTPPPDGPGPAGVALADAAALAYVISTSGSTGTPKQVEVEHGALRSTLGWYGDFFHLGPGVRTAAFAGLAFDASLLDLWAPLMRGATVVLPDDDVVRDLDALAAAVADVDHCFLPTPLTEQLLRGGYDTGRLRTLATGGDRLRVWPPADFGAAVHNLYGPTEATILVTATGDLRRTGDRSAPPAIGAPVAGARLSLDPPSTRPGDEGELLISGPVLARGYRHDDTGTATAFTTDGGTGLRSYRTGDVCRWGDDGELHFVGRVDGQVKIRGNRIELREVELALLAVPGVTQAAAGVVEPAGDPVLAAWVAGPVDDRTVAARLAERLPAAMVPSRIAVLAALPLTSNGKLDRAALRADAERVPADGGSHRPADQPAGSPLPQAVVARVWAALLGSDPGPDDDFFLAGGDSLLAVRLTAQLRRDLGGTLRPSLLFEHRRFADYVAAVEAALAPAPDRPTADGAGSAR